MDEKQTTTGPTAVAAEEKPSNVINLELPKDDSPSPKDGGLPRPETKLEMVLNHKKRREQERQQKRMQDAQRRMRSQPVQVGQLAAFEHNVKRNVGAVMAATNTIAGDLGLTILNLDALVRYLVDRHVIDSVEDFRNFAKAHVAAKVAEKKESGADVKPTNLVSPDDLPKAPTPSEEDTTPKQDPKAKLAELRAAANAPTEKATA